MAGENLEREGTASDWSSASWFETGLLAAAELPVTRFLAYTHADRQSITFKRVKTELGMPFMVKSASLGSSVGVSKVTKEDDFEKAVDEAFRYDDKILFEEYIKGREIECAILGNNPPEASLPGEIIISKSYAFYTFDAKYVDGEAVTIEVPAKLKAKISDRVRAVSIEAYKALCCEDFARVDLFVDEDENIYINEINTIPGFTNSSMFPMMWKERGVSFTELISKLIDLAEERFEKNRRIERDFQSSLKF
ncbi:MAG: D-alanine--D-alanine ligase [Bacteroidia bacterium]|nr:D-alanine--D-alanine ligase [Bacteroidia bacterium]